MIRTTLSVTFLFLLGYTLICVYFYLQQRSFLYFPVPALGSLETIAVQSELEEVRASVANAEAPDALVYFGGNAEDVSITAEQMADRVPHLAIYALHYRGYGDSAGTPSEVALVADGSALLSQVMQKHSTVRVAGRSLGSGVAVQASAGQQIDSLVLITPFGSIQKIASRIYWFLPVSLLIKDPYQSTEFVDDIRADVHVIAAEHDAIIPWWSTRDLVDSFGDERRVKVTVVKGRDHNDLQLDPEYWALLAGAQGP